MLCKMVILISGKVVALHLDNSTTKACLCNQGGTASTFFQTSLPHFESGHHALF